MWQRGPLSASLSAGDEGVLVMNWLKGRAQDVGHVLLLTFVDKRTALHCTATITTYYVGRWDVTNNRLMWRDGSGWRETP